MATKRRKLAPQRIGGAMPQWARDLVERCIEPASGTRDEVEFCDWLFWGEPIGGLNAAASPEGQEISRRRSERGSRRSA